MMNVIRYAIASLVLCLPSLAHAQGTLPFALQQQFSFTNCVTFTNACGTPLAGGLLQFYQAGTNNVVQDSFQDVGLTIKNPWPLTLDDNGRVPMFYLASGSVHVRLLDANGVPQFDVASALVIGPSGGGGGGGSVDPTTVLSTGDIKSRGTSEFVTGWVKINGQTIGNAGSGASQRANADAQALFVYLWTNCPDAHCPVLTGRGASGLADFNALKQITLPDLRGRICGLVGLDDMGNTAAGRLLASNVTSGGGDTTTTPNATGGEANHALTTAELASHTHSITDVSHTHTVPISSQHQFVVQSGEQVVQSGGTITSSSSFTGITGTNSAGSGTAHNNMPPFMLGTCYMKL